MAAAITASAAAVAAVAVVNTITYPGIVTTVQRGWKRFQTGRTVQDWFAVGGRLSLRP